MTESPRLRKVLRDELREVLGHPHLKFICSQCNAPPFEQLKELVEHYEKEHKLEAGDG